MNFSDLNDDVLLANYLNDLDEQLGSEGIAIPGRPLRAMALISKQFKTTISWSSSLSERVDQWFQARYGDKLKMDFSTGKMVLKIKHDLYLAQFPLIYGQVQVNPLTWIQGVPSGLWQTLTEQEINDVAEKVMWGYEQNTRVVRLTKVETDDIGAAIHFLFSPHPNFSLSKWSSLQSAEKALKAFLKSKNASFPKTHNLQTLIDRCEANGLSKNTAIKSLAAKIQCDPSIRYGEVIKKEDALEAHYACIELCAIVSDAMPTA